MTQTIDQRAEKMLNKHYMAYKPVGLRENISAGHFGPFQKAVALAALTEALTRIEELEGALGFYASVVRYQGPNQRAMPDDKWTDDDAVYRLDVTRDGGAIARATLTKGIKE